jgi:hypothetical protein
MNPRLLLICYYFPPLGGAGVGRPLSLFRLLPSLGIDCDVLTVKDVGYRVFEPELLNGLDISRIHRSGSRDPQRLLRLVGVRCVGSEPIRHAAPISSRYFPDPKIGWVRPAVRLARRLIRENRYSAILSTSPPVSCHLVAQKVQAETGLPWIADFRDFWTSHRIEDDVMDRARRERAWELINFIKDSAAAVTTCNPAISEYLGGGEVIYNGFDDNLVQHWQPPSDKTVVNIGLLGTFDELVPIEPLLKLLAILHERSPNLFDAVRLVQVGQVDPGWLETMLRRCDMPNICTRHGFQSRRRSIEILSESSLLYLSLASSKECGIVPSRLFDMLASGRPILAALPPGSAAADLIGRSDRACCFDPSKPEEVDRGAEFVERIAQQQLSGQLSIAASPEYARPFSAAAMVQKFADVIRNL